MKRFIGYTTNGNFSIGCTGQTVHLFDKNNNEIAKFKDIIYAYAPILSPDGRIFVVKSTAGMLAVYSLETVSLVKKFRFSKVDGAQDDGCCFTADGKWFVNIERQKDALHSTVSIYDISDFSLVKQVSFDDYTALNYIECDESTNTFYVLGYMRDADKVFDYGFVAAFAENELCNVTPITTKEYEFYNEYKHLELMGFSEYAVENADLEGNIDELKARHPSLKDLYMSYHPLKMD